MLGPGINAVLAGFTDLAGTTAGSALVLVTVLPKTVLLSTADMLLGVATVTEVSLTFTAFGTVTSLNVLGAPAVVLGSLLHQDSFSLSSNIGDFHWYPIADCCGWNLWLGGGCGCDNSAHTWQDWS